MTDTKPEPNFIHSRGMKFPDDPTILRGRVRKLLRQNAYDAKESEAALRVVREGDRVIELGGGVGYMSTLVASKRNVASVHSFEANPNLIPYIRRVHAANGLSIVAALNLAGFAQSNGEARRLIRGGGARLNDQAITDEEASLNRSDFVDGKAKISAGKKRHALIVLR